MQDFLMASLIRPVNKRDENTVVNNRKTLAEYIDYGKVPHV